MRPHKCPLVNPHPLWLFWGGRHMSWLRYMTVRSAVAVHSNVCLVLRREPHEQPVAVSRWVQDQELKHKTTSDENWLNRATAVAHRVLYLEDVAPELAAGRFSDVHVSDLLAYYLLGLYGGTVADMDIVFFKPLPAIAHDVQVPVIRRRENVPSYVPVGFMQGKPCAEWMATYQAGLQRLDPAGYQSAGTDLVSTRGWTSGLPSVIVYPFCNYTMSVSRPWYFQSDAYPPIPAETIGVHWYAGANQALNRRIKCHEDLKYGAVKEAVERMPENKKQETLHS